MVNKSVDCLFLFWSFFKEWRWSCYFKLWKIHSLLFLQMILKRN